MRFGRYSLRNVGPQSLAYLPHPGPRIPDRISADRKHPGSTHP